jgi:hypothetical protein
MDYKNALHNLGITGKIDSKKIRQAYHKGCLRFHPDRTGTDTCEEFNKIKDSYEYLMENEHLYKTDNDVSPNSNPVRDMYVGLLDGVIDMLVKNDNEMFRDKIYHMLHNINVPEKIINNIKSIVVRKIPKVCNISPTLVDILQDHIYKLEYDGNSYLIPMWWGNTTINSASGKTITINMNYNLPDYVSIDRDNNIIVSKRYSIKSLDDKDVIEFEMAGITFQSKIKIISNQTITFPRRGMLCHSVDDIVSDYSRKDVILHLSLY